MTTQDDNKKAGYGQMPQSRSAIFSAVIIICVVDLLAILFIFLSGTTPGARVVPPIFQIISVIIDVFLGINLLRGKNWARIWMLVRAILGIVVWGGLFAILGDYGSVIYNIGVLLALIILLTGTSNHPKLAGSVTLAVVAIVLGNTWNIIGPSIHISSVPETSSIPDSFSNYTSEGFFSIRYPPDWTPVMSTVAETEEEMKQYLKDSGMGSQANEIQLVFLCGKVTQNGNSIFVSVSVEPSTFWPLETLVENTNQWSIKNVEQYVEHSRVRTTIGGRKSIIQIYQGKDVDSILTGCTTAYIAGDKFLWTVVCGSEVEDFESNRATFDQVVRSLRVEY